MNHCYNCKQKIDTSNLNSLSVLYNTGRRWYCCTNCIGGDAIREMAKVNNAFWTELFPQSTPPAPAPELTEVSDDNLGEYTLAALRSRGVFAPELTPEQAEHDRWYWITPEPYHPAPTSEQPEAPELTDEQAAVLGRLLVEHIPNDIDYIGGKWTLMYILKQNGHVDYLSDDEMAFVITDTGRAALEAHQAKGKEQS